MMVRFPAALAALAWAAAAGAGQIQICDIQPNIDYSCVNCTPTTKSLPIAVFDFSKQQSLSSLSALSFTMSAQVPDPSNVGLHLALNGIDTGLALNGFDKATLKELTFSAADGKGLTPQVESALLQSIADHKGLVTATLLADSPDKLKLQLYSDTNLTLCFTGLVPETPSTVPEPGAALLWGFAAVAVAWRRRVAA